MPPTTAVSEVQHLSLDKINPSSSNPRKQWDKEKLAELGESIRARGVLQPLLVRAAKNFRFEIIAGERRWRAAKMAGLTAVPCLVRESSDAEADYDRITENLQREGISALEEAEGLKKRADAGDQVKDIAANVGKSTRYVYDALALVKLAQPSKKLLLEGGITRTHAVLLSRLPASTQRQVIEDGVLDSDYDGVISADDLEERLNQDYYRNLKDASWKLDDEQLDKKAGSCLKCPKRTGNMPGCEPKKGNLCTDPACFTGKMDAHIEFLQSSCRLIAISTKSKPYSDANPKIKYAGEYTVAPKGKECSAVRSAQIVEGDDVGSERRVCVASSCTIHKPAVVDNYTPQWKKWKKQAAQRALDKVDSAVAVRLLQAVHQKTLGAAPLLAAAWPMIVDQLGAHLEASVGYGGHKGLDAECAKLLSDGKYTVVENAIPKLQPKALPLAAFLLAMAAQIAQARNSALAKKAYAALHIDPKKIEQQAKAAESAAKKAKAKGVTQAKAAAFHKAAAKVSKTPARKVSRKAGKSREPGSRKPKRGSQAPANKARRKRGSKK